MRPVLLLFVALALSVASPAAAVSTQLGLLAGFSYSVLDIEGRDLLDGRGSFAAGGVVDFGLNDRFGIRIEPAFLSKGGKDTQRNPQWGSNDGAVFQLDYIDLPVLARFDLATSEDRGYLLGGVGVSFATQQEVELTQGSDKETVDLGDVFSPTDVSLNLGAGWSLAVGANRMTFDARVAYGLVNINEGGTVTVAGTPVDVPSTNTRTIDFRLLATYMFPMGRK